MRNYNSFVLIFTVLFISACSNLSNSELEESKGVNRELENDFQKAEIITPEKQLVKDSLLLVEQGYESKPVKNGNTPDCYNFTPKYNKRIKNELKVTVGGGTDVVIKLMDIKSDRCIRYVFINSGTEYSIKNIPEGEYYVKIAYGKGWMCTVSDKQCTGRFLKNPMYEKGQDIMDFNIKHSTDGYSIPSYALELDVLTSSSVNSFNSQGISENQFNM